MFFFPFVSPSVSSKCNGDDVFLAGRIARKTVCSVHKFSGRFRGNSLRKLLRQCCGTVFMPISRSATAKRAHFHFIAFSLHLPFFCFLLLLLLCNWVTPLLSLLELCSFLLFPSSVVAFLFAKLKAIAGGARRKAKEANRYVCCWTSTKSNGSNGDLSRFCIVSHSIWNQIKLLLVLLVNDLYTGYLSGDVRDEGNVAADSSRMANAACHWKEEIRPH